MRRQCHSDDKFRESLDHMTMTYALLMLCMMMILLITALSLRVPDGRDSEVAQKTIESLKIKEASRLNIQNFSKTSVQEKTEEGIKR